MKKNFKEYYLLFIYKKKASDNYTHSLSVLIRFCSNTTHKNSIKKFNINIYRIIFS